MSLPERSLSLINRTILILAEAFKTGPQNFTFTKQLGKGAYGTVLQFYNSAANDNLSVKVLDKGLVPYEIIVKEVLILKYLSPHCSNYILCYRGYLTDDSYYYILTEYLDNYISLNDFAGRYQLTPSLINNLRTGLRELHRLGVVHRDIKPENIMAEIGSNGLPTGNIKYIDFGLSCANPNFSEKNITCKSMEDFIFYEKIDEEWLEGILKYLTIV